MTVKSPHHLDRETHLHPFTSLRALQLEGPYLMSSANGMRIKDTAGFELIDAAAGLWCVNVGYGRTEIVDAVSAQMSRLAFFQSFNGTSSEVVACLAGKILSLAPAGMRRVFFGNSGSDANDTAVKLVWLFNTLLGRKEKKKIIGRNRGYHGVTVASGSITGLPGVHRLFDLPLPMMRHVSAPDTYRHPERDAAFYANELDAAIRAEGAHTVAAFFAEPVMGTGGVLVPPDGYFDAIGKVLKTHDVLLVLDEVISGFGRLGKWFGADEFKVQPDIITCAKGLTSSYLPMSGVIIGDRVWSTLERQQDVIGVLGHGFTTSGHPAAAAAAMANLKIIEDENLVDRCHVMGKVLYKAVQESLGQHPLVGDIRSAGLMLGIELVQDRDTKTGFDPSTMAAARVTRHARQLGLLVRALPLNDVIALSPAFIVDTAAIEEIVTKLTAAVERFAAEVTA